MTKEEFENYNGLLYCRNCKTYVPKTHIYHKKVYKNGEIARCNVCEWIKRHGGIPSLNGFSDDEIVKFLHLLLYSDEIYINDIATSIDRSLDETICLFKALNVKNKKCLVKVQCEYCKRIVNKPINVYLTNDNTYCSSECYWKDKPNKVPHGEESPFYSRIRTACTNCGKEINVIPHNFNIENSFGDRHNFCSQECYWEYRSKYYIGEKSTMSTYEFTDEQREKMRLTILEHGRSSSRFNSKIQLKINDVLDAEKIKYEREYIIKYYAVDNYLPDFNLIIEIMGDYWHGNPLRYNEDKYMLNSIQQRTILKDKQKSSYIFNHKNIKILYLWETDINNRIDLCRELILKYIKNNGVLENYHSFNWDLKDGGLFLCEEIINPYQNMSSDKYKKLIKQ